MALPGPWRLVTMGWRFRGPLWSNTVPTLVETGVGFGVSVAVSLTVAVALDLSHLLRRALYPLLVASQAVPLLAVAPLFVTWFGLGLAAKVAVVVVYTFFPLTVAVVEGLAATDEDATRLLVSMGAGRWKRFRLLRAPGALPWLFAGLRVGVTYAVVAAVVSEYVGASRGLGVYMLAQENSLRTDLVLDAVAVTVVVSLLLFASTYLVQWLVMPWQRGRQRRAATAGR